MNSLDQLAYFAAVKTDFKVFTQQAFTSIYPGKEYDDSWHLDAILHCLEQAGRGRMPRLIINLPPRHLKSFIVSVVWPAFILGRDASAKIICISYSDDLAKTLSRDFKRILDSEWYRRIFPEVLLTKGTEGEAVTDQGGFRYATSVGGTLTGRGADIIILDDPIKPADALSDKSRQSVNEWCRTTLLSRLDDKERSVLVLVMQRLHVNDPTGFLEAGGGFHKLSLPAVALRDELIPLRHGSTHRRLIGTALHPEREGIHVLNSMRDQMGTRNFLAQYQQSPETPDGAMFKRRWLNLVSKRPEINRNGKIYVSVDTALSTAETADYSAISLVYTYDTKYWVLTAERGRWDYEALRAKALGYGRLAGSQVTYVVEAAGSGISLISYLKKQQMSCFHYSPRNAKETRAAYAVPVFDSGRVSILNETGANGWVEAYVNEFVSFPYGRFDDQVDSLVQLVNFAEQGRNPEARDYYS